MGFYYAVVTVSDDGRMNLTSILLGKQYLLGMRIVTNQTQQLGELPGLARGSSCSTFMMMYYASEQNAFFPPTTSHAGHAFGSQQTTSQA